MKNSAEYFYLNFIKKEKISKDVFAFYFNKKNFKLSFLAGQYIHIYLPIADERGRGNSRMFTISSSPLEKNIIFIATKKGKSLFKKTLFKLTPKTSVKFYGPSGSLVLNDPPAGEKKPSYVFLALGIGITPFRSIIKYVSQKNLKIPITLIVSFSKKEDFLFYEELLEISKSNPNIKIAYHLKRIDKKIIKKYIKNIHNHTYFIVGSPSGVAYLEEVVSSLGIDDNKLFIEDFEGY